MAGHVWIIDILTYKLEKQTQNIFVVKQMTSTVLFKSSRPMYQQTRSSFLQIMATCRLLGTKS